MQKSARWRLQATVVKLTYQLQSLYLPSFGIELGQRKIQSSSASYISIKQTQNEIHLEIIIFRGLSPLLLKVRGAQASAAPVVHTATGLEFYKIFNLVQYRIMKLSFLFFNHTLIFLFLQRIDDVKIFRLDIS